MLIICVNPLINYYKRNIKNTYMKTIEEKIKRAIERNKLNPEILGERYWYNYFIRTTKLVWARNFHDGYQIEVYTEKCGDHLDTVTT